MTTNLPSGCHYIAKCFTKAQFKRFEKIIASGDYKWVRYLAVESDGNPHLIDVCYHDRDMCQQVWGFYSGWIAARARH